MSRNKCVQIVTGGGDNRPEINVSWIKLGNDQDLMIDSYAQYLLIDESNVGSIVFLG